MSSTKKENHSTLPLTADERAWLDDANRLAEEIGARELIAADEYAYFVTGYRNSLYDMTEYATADGAHESHGAATINARKVA